MLQALSNDDPIVYGRVGRTYLDATVMLLLEIKYQSERGFLPAFDAELCCPDHALLLP